MEEIRDKEFLTEKEAISLLKKYSLKGHFIPVLSHSKRVSKIALMIAKKVDGSDLNFIKSASILHDIGRFSCPPKTKKSICHGVVGARILRRENLPKHALVAERHIGIGIAKEEIIKQKLPLPKKDFIPQTIEEKIIAYADNLDFRGKRQTPEWVVARFSREISPEYGQRVKSFNKEIIGLQRMKKR